MNPFRGLRSAGPPIAAGLILGGAWFSLSLYLLNQVRAADAIRSLADRIRIDLLEARRREKDFLLRSLSDPAFYLQGTTPPLQLHREAIDRLGRECEELNGRVDADWGTEVRTLLARKKDYDEAFTALTSCYRRLGTKDFGLEGSWRRITRELEPAIEATGNAGLQRGLLLLKSDEREYLLDRDEIGLRSVHRRADQLREALGRTAPETAPALQERLDRYLQELAASRALELQIGLNEDLGLHARFRQAAHAIEPIVSRVGARASEEHRRAAGRLTAGFLVASLLLSALLSTTFFLTRSARTRSRHLSESSADLSRSNAELQQFAYVASHDLQEPLRAVAGCVQLLQQRAQGKLDERCDELIRHAVEGCLRMQTLIEDLLTLSRVGTQAKPFVATDSGKVLQAALDNLAVPLKESGATLTHDAMPTVEMDPTQMLQVFQNLLSNALKFRAERAPVIHVGAGRSGKEWIFSVRDNGIGIEPQYFARIFRIFQRLHTRREYPGSGIGLAVCEKIVLRHGGRMWLQSELNRGTTFYFTLPCKGDVA